MVAAGCGKGGPGGGVGGEGPSGTVPSGPKFQAFFSLPTLISCFFQSHHVELWA